ncbi:MAG: protein kinase [Phycisphaerales bacterium]
MSANEACERFQRIEAIFRRARELGGAERDDYIASTCADDAAMRIEVVGMLRADDRPAGVLDQPALGGDFDLARLEAAADASRVRVPGRIGHYEIVRRIGHGGMGVVYEAQQEEPRRSVALKVMNAGTSGRRSLRRFRHEAQVLGRLQHPGIAQIFEAGVDDWGDGPQPYFAMELVRGAELARYVRDRRLGVRERLALLAKVCDAVHHAHQKGVIHRDLKPANILVVEGGDDDTDGSGSRSPELVVAQPKILDFGVARLLDPDASSATGQTNAGQILGTVPYMSPEQAEGDGAALDIRTDIYSLGVVAFELLVDRHPHDLHGKPLHEALRMLREREPPRLGSIDRRLRGDVETIVAKALERTPRRRFASAAEMAADLRRVLRHEPIQARRAGPLEQMRKFARRHRGIVVAGAVAALAMAVATAAAIRLAVVAERAGIDERRLREIADDRADAAGRAAYQSMLAAAAASLRWHETEEARQQLDAVPAERRGWEWRHLHSRLDDSMVAALDGPVSMVRVAFNPSGEEIVLATANGVLERRRADDLSLVAGATMPGSYRARWTTGMVPSGAGAFWISARAAVVEIDATSLTPIHAQQLPRTVVAVDPTGRFIVRQSTPATHEPGEQVVELVRIADNTTIASGAPMRAGGAVAEFSRDGGLAAFCQDGADGLLVHSTDDGREILHRADLRFVSRLRFNGDRSLLAVATFDGAVHLLPLDDAAPLPTLLGHQAAVSAIDFSPDGSRLATAARDETVRFWSLADGRALAVMHGHGAAPNDLAFSPDGTRVVTVCGGDRSIRLWSATEGHDPRVLPTPQTVYSLAFSPDGSRLAAACLGGDRPVRVWDVDSEAETGAFGEGAASAIAFDDAGRRLAVGRAHGDTTVIDAVDGAVLATLPGHWWRTDWLRFVGHGTEVLSLGNSSTLLRHDAATGKRLDFKRHLGAESTLGMSAALAPAGDMLAVTANADIVLLDPRTLIEIGRLIGHEGSVHAVAFSPDGTRLASGGMDRVIRLWDVATRHVVATLEAHIETVYAIAFSPDGRRIASGGNDRVVRIWDAVTFDQLVRLHGHGSFVYCLAWRPDGSCLASGGGDDTVRLWDTRPFRESRRAVTGGASPANVD